MVWAPLPTLTSSCPITLVLFIDAGEGRSYQSLVSLYKHGFMLRKYPYMDLWLGFRLKNLMHEDSEDEDMRFEGLRVGISQKNI